MLCLKGAAKVEQKKHIEKANGQKKKLSVYLIKLYLIKKTTQRGRFPLRHFSEAVGGAYEHRGLDGAVTCIVAVITTGKTVAGQVE